MNFIVSALRVHGAMLVRLAVIVVLASVAGFGDAPASQAASPTACTGVPLQLNLCTEVSLGYKAHDIVLDGKYAYVATEKGLTIFDISDPLLPVKKGSELATGSNRSNGLAKKGDYVYLAASRAGMQVIDVTDPDDPVTIANAVYTGKVWDVAVHPTGNAAYAITYDGELYVWNIANPATPVLTQTLGIRHFRGVCETCVEAMRNLTTQGAAQAVGVSAAGNVVVGVDWAFGGLYAWDSTDPLHLTFKGTHRVPVGFRAEVDLARDVVYYLATYASTSGVHTVPLSRLDPFVTSYSSTIRLPTGTVPCADTICDFVKSSVAPYSGAIGFSGKYAFYVAPRGYGELGILDATDPGNMVKVASKQLGITNLSSVQAAGVVSRRDIIYVAAGLRGVQVWQFPGLSTPTP